MKKNVGNIDRIIRIIIGLMILGAGYYYESWLGLIGIVPIMVALINRCPLYMPFGINTCRSKEK